MQVPTTRSRQSWGIGDLGDVDAVARWLASHGAGVLGLSPLHASTPVAPLPSSPYSPSSRRWRNPSLLRVDAIAGAGDHPAVQDLAEQARLLLHRHLLDRDAVWALQQRALELLWRDRSGRQRAALARFRDANGAALEQWARYCALAEVHGPVWPEWPAGLRHPDGPGVDTAVAPLADRVAFHAWLQLELDEQVTRAATHGVRLIQDLAIGADPGGADAWALQDILALDVSVGAPPDEFAPQGQRWALPPFIPWRLRDAGYRPLAELLRASLGTGGGLRVDHVMGLARLFWIPDGADPADGAYVRFHGRELLEVLAMESARCEAVVVGEDLGTVEDQFRRELADTNVLSTRVVWFEDQPPEDYPEMSLGVVTTHDLPTVAGLWTGRDEQELERVGRPSPSDATARVRQRAGWLTGLDPDTRPADDLDDLQARLHHRLGAGRSMIALATLEDACAVEDRPNVPGSTTERPNWSIALPIPVEAFDTTASVRRVIDSLAQGRGPTTMG
jgi:4-alpha-glucanotransferase